MTILSIQILFLVILFGSVLVWFLSLFVRNPCEIWRVDVLDYAENTANSSGHLFADGAVVAIIAGTTPYRTKLSQLRLSSNLHLSKGEAYWISQMPSTTADEDSLVDVYAIIKDGEAWYSRQSVSSFLSRYYFKWSALLVSILMALFISGSFLSRSTSNLVVVGVAGVIALALYCLWHISTMYRKKIVLMDIERLLLAHFSGLPVQPFFRRRPEAADTPNADESDTELNQPL